MSQKRQNGIRNSSDKKAAATTLNREYPHGYFIPSHCHDRDQLLYASRGVMTVSTDQGTWVVPPQRAVWIPAGISHSVTMSGAVTMRTIYFRRRLAKDLPRQCCVLNIPNLLKELILHACTLGVLTNTVRWQRDLLSFLLHQLKTVKTVPLQLPNMTDPRLVRIAQVLTKDPCDKRPLSQLCRVSGASKRSIERLFKQETGMTFARWRQQLRLFQGIRLLAEGAKVTHAALDSGYSTSSAFISMFKKALGVTPSAYFHTHESLTSADLLST
jgi:AraC-like DNA-binding protein